MNVCAALAGHGGRPGPAWPRNAARLVCPPERQRRFSAEFRHPQATSRFCPVAGRKTDDDHTAAASAGEGGGVAWSKEPAWFGFSTGRTLSQRPWQTGTGTGVTFDASEGLLTHQKACSQEVLVSEATRWDSLKGRRHSDFCF